MQERQWYQTLASLILLGTVVSIGMAQEGAPIAASPAASSRIGAAAPKRSVRKAGTYGFLSLLDQRLVLSPEQQDSIRGLLASQRESMQSVREETDGKIRALLTPEQQKKFDALLAEQKSRRAQRFQRS